VSVVFPVVFILFPLPNFLFATALCLLPVVRNQLPIRGLFRELFKFSSFRSFSTTWFVLILLPFLRNVIMPRLLSCVPSLLSVDAPPFQRTFFTPLYFYALFQFTVPSVAYPSVFFLSFHIHIQSCSLRNFVLSLLFIFFQRKAAY